MEKEVFLSPPKEHRPAPFWSWNDDLENEELVWQVEQMKEQGFGGYFMHSRVGLVTEYLSPEWMDRVRACLEAGKRVGMESWLYDEDKWPSGFAGGIVPAMSDEYKGRGLSVRKIKPENIASAKEKKDTVAIFAVVRDAARSVKRCRLIYPGQGTVKKAEGDVFVVTASIAQRSNWYNRETYVDLLNPRTTEAFIQSTHEPYYKHFGRDFGEFMPGIFTDEPNYRSVGVTPWTDEFPAYFRERCGYDIVEKIPLLFVDGEGCHKVRYDFWRAITARFLESFSKPLFDWCEQHGSMLTGHYLAEDNLLSQIEVIGAAMPHYEYMQLPGIDHLGRNINDPLTLKQVSSAAHQFGRNRVLCEIFGVSGHSMSFEDMKWIADFHFALGITFMNQHLTLYSMTGDRKRDYPPTISYHQPYWQYYRAVNDYFARCAYMVTRGDFSADVLVFHPIGSAWASMVTPLPGKRHHQVNPEVMRYNGELVRLQDHLLSSHYDFDYGDEMIMATHASVEDGKLAVGGMRYSVVVIPPSLTWSHTTFGLLEKFLANGGHIVAVGQLPTMIDAEASERWQKLLGHANVLRCENSRQEVAEALGRIIPRDVSITDENGDEVSDIYYHHRVCGPRHIYFMSSKNRDRGFEATVSVRGAGAMSEWRPADGRVEPVGATVKNGRTVLDATFSPTGSHIFVLDTESKPGAVALAAQKETVAERFAGPWRFKRTHLNSLTLDYCRLSTQGSAYGDWMPVWKARHEIVRVFGVTKYAGIQPWALIKKGVKVAEEDRRVKLQFRFAVEKLPESAFLVVEKAKKFRIRVNGAEVPAATAEWYWDKQFGKLEITDRLVDGENVVELACDYTIDTEIEDIYLVGDFGVRSYEDTRFALVGEPVQLEAASWTAQRYPFYAGTMVYYQGFEHARKDGERVFIQLVNPRGCAFAVSVNGKEGGLISWRPWEIDVTSLVKDGTNEIAVEVIGTLRNTMGPLHHKGGDLYSVGPGNFTDERNWTDVYQFAPYGILGEIQLVKVQ